MNIEDKVTIWSDRFRGRQDVFGVEHVRSGSNKKLFTPYCENFFKPGCHLSLQDGKNCTNCELKKYRALNYNDILGHITGVKSLLIYVLCPNNQIHFGVIDFDNKPERQQHAYFWEDVVKVAGALTLLGIPFCTARSTNNGWHIYIFFSEPYSAARFRSIIFHIFERVGFMEDNSRGIRPIPEVFPRQSEFVVESLGNGIKPGLIETRFPLERNGLVNVTGDFIHSERQWHALSSVPFLTPELAEKVIADNKIDVIEAMRPILTSSKRKEQSGTMQPVPEWTVPEWTVPDKGSMENLFSGCSTLRLLRDKCARGEKISHDEGFLLFHMAMHVKGGIEWFNSNVPNWGVTEADKRQLAHSLRKSYSPWTCRKIQEKRICPFNNPEHCKISRPHNGEYKDPSPISFAWKPKNRGEDMRAILAKIRARNDQ